MIALRVLVAIAIIAFVSAEYKSTGEQVKTYGKQFTFDTVPGTGNSADFTDIAIDAVYVTKDIVRLRGVPTKLSAGQEMPFEVPADVGPYNTNPDATTAATSPNYAVSVENNKLVVKSNVGGVAPMTILELGSLMYRQQNISFTTGVTPNAHISGFGEHNYYYFINKGDDRKKFLTLWNTDSAGLKWSKPEYGMHPVLFVADPAVPMFFGVFWSTTNAQRLTMETDTMTWGSVGGELNLFVITGESMLDVVSRYHSLIGPSMVPPYWSLGAHQSRWGYRNVSMMRAVVAGYKAANLPLEVMWNDIDYMYDYRIFTTDPKRFPAAELNAFIDDLHAEDRYYMQIIDPGIAAVDDCEVFVNGRGNNSFVKMDGKILINALWPGWSAFPDYTAPWARKWWGEELAAYMDRIKIDGVWLDMNEPAPFCNAHCEVEPNAPWPIDWTKPVPWEVLVNQVCIELGKCSPKNTSLNYPPYEPLEDWFLFNTTLDMEADTHQGKMYNTKAFYALRQAEATHEAIYNKTGKRAFVLSRASYAGSGRYTIHWTGDDSSLWAPKSGGLPDSVQGILGSNLWGIPTIGAEIGGFKFNTTEELLVRWYQLGVFYTFHRNHNENQAIPQEPYLWSKNAIDAIRSSIHTRYRLLPYMFTQLIGARYNKGPALRHMSLQFPTDAGTYRETTQYMLGGAILLTPVVVEGASTVTGYVPTGQWYHMWTGVPVSGGVQRTFDAPLYGDAPILVLGGAAIPTHTKVYNTVKQTRASGISIVCALDSTGAASGVMMNDDGDDGMFPEKVDDVATATIECYGGSNDGWVRVTANKPRAIQPTERANITMYFPSTVPYTIASLKFTTQLGDSYTPLAAAISGNVMHFTLPDGVDGSSGFSIKWGPSGSSVPPAPSSGKDANKELVPIVAVLGVLLFASLIAIVVVVRKSPRTLDPEANYEMLKS